MTIHMIGKKPNAAPSAAASPACPAGIPYTASATTMPTPSEISAAHCAFILNTPSSRNSATSGRTAKIDVTPSEWDTGSSTCLYMSTPLRAAAQRKSGRITGVPVVRRG